jgi:N-acetylglucosaminyldiphosphoundecaprenol N-acetyl-beta-D-mannosaminyltransferase
MANLSSNFVIEDDLSRDVYCILGMPVDAIGMQSCLRRIEAAAASRMPFLVSTPNLNFLVNSHLDPDFRESLILSDLCPPDGMPIVWIAWLLGVPIKNRTAGSDIFEALKLAHNAAKPLKVFLFGDTEAAGMAASQALNAQPSGLYCVGSLYPGFGSVDELSRDDIIDKINSSGADFLVAALGSKKGQLWLQRNHHRLLVPVRSHLGAVIKFQAAMVRRAPAIMRKFGLEWLWRIKEEPYLWRRYWIDGSVLLRLLLTNVLPLAVLLWWLQVKYGHHRNDLVITQVDANESVTVSLSGPATARHVDKLIPVIRAALAAKKQIIIDFSNTCAIDTRFLGLLIMLRKILKGIGAKPIFIGLSPGLKSIFRLNCVEFLLVDNLTIGAHA